MPEPGAAIEVGLKLAVTPDGKPVAVSAMAELKPPETVVVIVEVPLLPEVTATVVGSAEIEKAGVAAAETTRETVADSVKLAPVPVILTE